MNLTLSEELSGASYRVDNGTSQADPTHFQVFKLPWSDELDVGSAHGTLHVSAAAGLLLAQDAIHVQSPSGLATVDEDWTALGAQLGVGWTWPFASGWNLRPGAAFALAYLRNDASYNAAGEIELKPLLEGTLVNWDGWESISSAMLTLEHPRDVERFSTGLVLRYAFAYENVFDATSALQEGEDTSQFVIARGEIGGPMSWSSNGQRLHWDAFGDWSGLYGIDKQSIGFDEIYQIGVGLTWRAMQRIPPVRLGTAWAFGPDISGWTIGLSLGV